MCIVDRTLSAFTQPMIDSTSRSLFNLYVDDSGTRHPDRVLVEAHKGDWFALGGVLLKADDEVEARQLHQAFCARWAITVPLHSVKIRHRNAEFAWLKSAPSERVQEFYKDLTDTLLAMPVLGHACVIDRPGYRARYFERYGRQRWDLCKTAFSVLCERVAKFAALHDRRVSIFVEESDPRSDRLIRTYFKKLRTEGMPFDKMNSSQYQPLAVSELAHRLLDLKFKRKSSPLMQIADLYLYPICRERCDPHYFPARELRNCRKLIDQSLGPEKISHLGIKYSCFDSDSKKGLVSETLQPASKAETS